MPSSGGADEALTVNKHSLGFGKQCEVQLTENFYKKQINVEAFNGRSGIEGQSQSMPSGGADEALIVNKHSLGLENSAKYI